MKLKKFNLFNDEGTLIYSSSKEFYANFPDLNYSKFVLIEVNKIGLINYKDGKKIVPAQYSKFWFKDNFIIGDKKKREGATIFDKVGKSILEVQDYVIISPDLLSVVFEDGKGAILNHKLEILQMGVKADPQPQSFHEGRCLVKSNDSKYGYIDRNGNLIIEPIFDYAENFENGRAVVGFEVNYRRKFGLINKKGEFILEPLYDDVRIGTSKISIIKTDNKYGLIDEKGDIIVHPIYDYIDDFIEVNQKNMARVKVDGKYGLINERGDVIIEPVYEDIQISKKEDNTAIVKINGKYGVVDFEGNVIIPCIYDEIDIFYPEETEQKLYKAKSDGKYGLISSEKQIVIPFSYKYISMSSNVIIDGEKETGRSDFFTLDGKKLFDKEIKKVKYIGENLILCDDILINKEGKVLFKEVYIDSFSSFYGLTEDSLINISINHEYGYINIYGEIKIKPQFYYAKPFHNGYAVVDNKKDKTGVIDQTGNFIIDPIYDTIWEIDENLWEKWIVKSSDGTYALITKEGEIIFEEKKGTLWYSGSKSGLIKLSVNEKIGFINLNGEILVKPVYEEVEYFKEGVCPVSINGYWGLINDQGKEIVPPSFKRVLPHKWGKLNILESND